MIRYVCHFEFSGAGECTVESDHNAFSGGFWIDELTRLVEERDPQARWWIPPSQIRYVSKQGRP